MAKKKTSLKVDLDDIQTVDEKEIKTKKFVYKDPYWSNKENKHIIVTLEYPDGRTATASIQDQDGSNPDYKAIIDEFGEELLDKNTEEGIRRRDEQVKKRLQTKEAESIRAKQEQLFGAKLQAFEISAVKESSNIELKRLIRKAKSPMEVQAYTTILLMETMDEQKES